VLIVAGDQDTTTLPEASAFMQAAIPGAQLTTLAPAKHQGLLEHHAQFAQACGVCDACLRPGEDETRRREGDTDNPLTDACNGLPISVAILATASILVGPGFGE
jgi:hypothetical protein